ncbi:sulfatase [Streptomyces sp. NPDC059373]
MSFITRSRRLPDTDEATTEEGPTPDDTAPDDQDGVIAQEPDEAVTEETEEAVTEEAVTDRAAAQGGWRGRHPAAAQTMARVTTVLAGVLVLGAILVPNRLSHITPASFARIPVEGVLGAAVLLVLPPKVRRVAAVLGGTVLGLLTILKFLDMGFYSILVRPFDLVLDWVLLANAEEFVKESVGQAGAIAAVVGVVILALALPVVMTLAVLRLSRLMARHGTAATRGLLVLGTTWVACAALGAQVAGVPIATSGFTQFVDNRVKQVNASINDERVFAQQASVDAFSKTPPNQLLTGLRGKDVIFTFIESYGRNAVLDDPVMAASVDKVLANGTSRLKKAGFSSRSAWLKSPVTGAGSWLAHSTFGSGLWIDNQQRYRSLTNSNRMTLTSAFQRTGAWRTVGIVPGVRRAWPEGKFFGLDHIYDSTHLGYKGPYFSWTPVPDQFSLAAFERLEHGKKNHEPLMAQIILASSHNPWAPIAKTVGWDQLGDGTIFNAIKAAGKDPKEVWKDPKKVQNEYRRAIEYSLNSLIDYVAKYGDKNTVLVFLGDHQPVPTVVGDNASRDVPISIVAHDPAVLDRISTWNWQDGLQPDAKAPVWRMDSFRDRFLTAYGPKGGSTATP